MLPRLAVTEVSKTFGRQRVLDRMQLELAPGELHALVGQNGSGKSTLVKILSGVYAPDSGGRIVVDGTELGPVVKPRGMRQVGLSVVHQTLGLIEEASVVENVRAGRHSASRWLRRIDWKQERESVNVVLERLGARLDLDLPVARLSAEDRATVAIARAFQDHQPGRGVIIFDESTRALTADSYARFYEMVETVRRAGAAVLLISHRLEEVLEVSDRVTVLRDGIVTGAGVRSAELDERALIKLMLGRELGGVSRRAGQAVVSTSEVVVGAQADSVSGLTGEVAHDLSFTVAPGEVLGFTGLVGSGFEELPYLLSGAQPARAGVLMLDGTRFDLASLRGPLRRLAAAGVALVPERRAEDGLALDLSIEENMTIPRMRQRGSAVWSGLGWQRAETEQMITALGITPPRPDAIVATLSGGNQQKVLLAKWLAGQPRLLLLHEPTQAVDVSAREDIIEAVRDAAQAGATVIVAGSDPQELERLCDRVFVLRDGAIASELQGDFDADAIVHATFGQPTSA